MGTETKFELTIDGGQREAVRICNVRKSTNMVTQHRQSISRFTTLRTAFNVLFKSWIIQQQVFPTKKKVIVLLWQRLKINTNTLVHRKCREGGNTREQSDAKRRAMDTSVLMPWWWQMGIDRSVIWVRCYLIWLISVVIIQTKIPRTDGRVIIRQLAIQNLRSRPPSQGPNHPHGKIHQNRHLDRRFRHCWSRRMWWDTWGMLQETSRMPS